MNRPRDSQRSRAYTAEQRTCGLRGREFPELAETREFCDDVFRALRESNVVVSDGRGRRRGGVSGSNPFWIKMPRPTRYERYILHEIAHSLVERGPRDRSRIAWHGPEWAGVYLALVFAVMGGGAGVALASAFIANKVRYDDDFEFSTPQLERLHALRAPRQEVAS